MRVYLSNIEGKSSQPSPLMCRPALNRDTRSACKKSLFERRVLTVARVPSELVGVTETVRGRGGLILISASEALTVVTGFHDVAVAGHPLRPFDLKAAVFLPPTVVALHRYFRIPADLT